MTARGQLWGPAKLSSLSKNVQLLAHTDLKHEGKACYITVNISICPLSHPLPPPWPPMRYTRGSMSTFFPNLNCCFITMLQRPNIVYLHTRLTKKKQKNMPSAVAHHRGQITLGRGADLPPVNTVWIILLLPLFILLFAVSIATKSFGAPGNQWIFFMCLALDLCRSPLVR